MQTQILRNRIILWLLAVIILAHPLLYAQGNWQEYKSDHFIIYYHKQIPIDYIQEVSIKAEEYYRSIAENLGFSRYEFWLWDERAKIYIFKDAQEYRNQALSPYWSGGNVLLRRKIIHTYPWAEGFFDRLLPHELGHIMFREFVGFGDNVPLWFDEGVAILQEKSDIRDYSLKVSKLKRPIPVDKLYKITGKTLILPVIFYAQSASIVDYLLHSFGKDSFVQLCKYLKSGRNLKEAISYIYKFEDLKELEKAWLEYLDSLKESD